MNRIVIYIILGVIILSNSGCIKECSSDHPLSCVEEGSFKMYLQGPNASLSEYLFQDEIVYYLDPGYGGSDQNYYVINSDCQIIGNLGGLPGNSKINGVDFYKEAKFIKVVWKQ